MNGPPCLLHSLPVYKHPSPGSEEPPAPLTVLLILSLFLRRTEGSVLPAEQQVMEWLLLGSLRAQRASVGLGPQEESSSVIGPTNERFLPAHIVMPREIPSPHPQVALRGLEQ